MGNLLKEKSICVLRTSYTALNQSTTLQELQLKDFHEIHQNRHAIKEGFWREEFG
jgi:hypothetical protein